MGVVISKSAAEKFTSYKVEKTMFSVNDNDILINLYGDSENYKSFPKIGEHTTGKVLIASRRRDRRTSLYDFQSSRMQVLDPVNDDIIYTNGGVVVDIDVYSNKRLEEMRNGANVFTQEIIDVAENNYRYWKELATELEKIIPCKTLTESEIQQERNEFGCVIRHPLEREKNMNQYTDELSYYWKLSHEYIDDRIQWRYDGKQFENFRIMFTILKENPLTPGCKITGRYRQ